MPWARHRLPLTLAALLDAAGLILLAQIINTWRRLGLLSWGTQQGFLLLVLILIFLSLGWLFGSYTLLKLRRVSWSQALARIGSTVVGSLAISALLSYSFRLQHDQGLFFRGNLIPLFVLAGGWSGLVRLLLRRCWPLGNGQRWQVIATAEEAEDIQQQWSRTATDSSLPPITIIRDESSYLDCSQTESLALSSGAIEIAAMQTFGQEAVQQGKPVNSLVEMAEQELQRIPASWVGVQWLLFSGRIDGQRINPEKQLKRYADVVVSLLLLLVTSPLLLIICLAVKMQDGGPVLYKQQRTGLLGVPFEVLKIRTMVPKAENNQAQWAQEKDKRITPLGQWLRRLRLDELPQLINVLRGEMSLIGPRPERPELEKLLEEKIPNYRLRHWVRPGLSGWAQVNMPYSSSIEDSELKLSFDLFYLRNASVWLDLLILLKTIKIILKAAGR